MGEDDGVDEEEADEDVDEEEADDDVDEDGDEEEAAADRIRTHCGEPGGQQSEWHGHGYGWIAWAYRAGR